MNFSNALVPVRLRGINTRKVLGSPVSALRMAVASEAVGMCLLSYLIALLLVRLLSKTGFVDLVSGGISLEGQMPLLIACGGFVLLIGLIAGCWPAWYITSFSPALVLKGNFGLSPKGALVPQCVSRISVRGLFYFGYSGFVYHVAELQYASYAAWIR